MPLTWLGVHERIQHIATKTDRDGELRVMYGMTMADLQAKLAQPGSSVRLLPLGTFTTTCYKRGLVECNMAPAGAGEL